ncbi:DUF6544 family protein [Flavobacterium sp.]|uniref:DUF6544 family protein n=1 Tax=Flavobacterium sp. TaxID=239 RepID=UPI003750D87E
MYKYIFAFLLFIHGLIHFMGFAKAYNYGNITQLSKEISKPIGMVWLTTGFLFLICLALYLFKNQSWAYFGLIAMVVSQILIIYNWQDAKVGTIANVLILVFVIIGFFQIKFKNEYKSEVKIGLLHTKNLPKTLLSEDSITDLPEPVKKYIRYADCLDKPIVHNFRIDFSGKIRSHEKRDWMHLTSEQYNFIPTPTRLFYLDATMKGLPVAGFHCFKNGIAYMDIRLLSLFKVEFQKGAVMNESETVTFFNDMCCMAPATLIDKRIEWLQVEENKVKASFTNNGITISAWLYFNEKGELVNFVSEDRSALLEDGTTKKLKWNTPLRDYKTINGYKLASYAEAIYTYPDGDFTYATFDLEDVGFN